MSSEPRVGFRTVDGLRIRYADSDGPASQHLVLTSPWPESLPAFDRMWPRLSGIARLLAVDLPGFGGSERRSELLSPMAMSEFLIRVLDEWDITDPHLICPDIGTPAALFAAVRQPGRMQSLVISGLAHPLKEPPEVPDSGARQYLRSYPDQLPLLAGLLPGIFTPVQIIAGRRDPLVTVANAELLAARLPNSRLDVLDTGELIWAEASAQYSAIIAAWVNGGYLTGGIALGQP
jgi:pimeloyl-ACP methyl ester carboxylesterase